ncbi:putative leucine-rich repeat receptor-like protein kinase [Ananas comosus]|uniref:Putative leucine-rich repeat receptor-like protein kinase n=1 Tax=Ananas comosus TaxID=4615 RepID=A0A199VZN7_ANACO|nr:putative leucine-rich repeat receptor-like protein kinase [Ananas comosus]
MHIDFLPQKVTHIDFLPRPHQKICNLPIFALAAFRGASGGRAGALSSWNLSEPWSACATWEGVTCAGGRVSRLVLEGLSLSGPSALPHLARLDRLRVLSLKSNLLSGPIPDLSPLSTTLKLLFLSHNALSGPIPDSLFSLTRLYRLDLSCNNLSGPVPVEGLDRLDRLLTLRLDSNRLSGPVSALALPRLQDLNLSSNLLSGAIPAALAAFPAASFAANAALCGAPLPPCRDFASDPTRPSARPPPRVPPAAAVVASSPSSSAPPSRGGRVSRAAVVGIVAGDFALLVLVSGLLFCYFWRKFAAGRKAPSRLHEGEKIVYSASPYGGGGAGYERGKMVFLGDGSGSNKRFELEDLLRASAEMLGKGSYGTAYKAVLDDGSVAAVKRLRDVQVSGKREFEQHLEQLGRLCHPNLVPLTAYYYAPDEKLLVYDYMPNGSLFSLLHGNRGPGRTPVDWGLRMQIAAGAARGLAHIHHARRSPKLAHGNVKSTNVLLDKAGNARLADYGLALMVPSAGASRSAGYRPPEAPPADGRRAWATQRGDVYAFGVLLLELLTGRPAASDNAGGGAMDLPTWVQSVVREEWTAELALRCTAAAPEQRPKIGQVVRVIDEVRAASAGGGEVSPSHESFDSISDSPSVSEDAAAAGAASQ